jgi:c-di-GMP-binding flagellar brake protein YcgR
MKKTILLPTLVISMIFLIFAVIGGAFVIKSQLDKNTKDILTLRIYNGERIFNEFFDESDADFSKITKKFKETDNIVVSRNSKIFIKTDREFLPNRSKINEVLEENGCFVMSAQLKNGYFITAYEDADGVTDPLKIFVTTGICGIILFAILIFGVLSTVIKSKITEPLEKVIKVNKEIAKGNTNAELITKNSKETVFDLVVSTKDILEYFQNQLKIIENLANGEAEQNKVSAKNEQDDFSKYFKIIAGKISKHATLPPQFKEGIELKVDVITELDDFTSNIVSIGADGLFISMPVDKDGKPFNAEVSNIYNISFVDNIAGTFAVSVEVAEIKGKKLAVRPVAKILNEQRRNYVRVPATGITAVMTTKIFDEDKKNIVEISEIVDVMDVSLGGIRIKTGNILKEKSAVKLKLKAEVFGELDIIGEVRRTFSVNGSLFAGIEFFADNDTNEVLYKFIRNRELEIFSAPKN